MGFDPRTKVWPAFVTGKRTKENIKRLIEKIKEVSDDTIPLFTSDELRHYEGALLKTYGLLQNVPREPGKRGRSPKPKLVPHPDLKYAQVVKHRRRGRVISMETAVIFGDEGEIKELLSSSPVSWSINISFVEWNNLSLRQNSKRLARKTNGFSKELERLEAQLYLASGITILSKSISACVCP